MSMKMIPLGINGFFPSFGRHTMSILVLTPREAVLLDAGTGVSRFSELRIKELVRPYERLNVVLSHYHLDHIVGLPYLAGMWKQGRVRIYAPGKPFVDVEPEHTLDQFLRPPFFPATLQDFPIPMEVIPVRDPVLQIGNLSVRLKVQNHPGGSAGIRIEDAIAYLTDTTVEQGSETFVHGVGLLLHEVYLTDAEAEQDPMERSRHSNVSAVAQMAKRSAVARLMPIHHNPWRPNAEISRMAREMERRAKIEVLIPEEGRIYAVD
jgi:ribonuclease BN (tRNA processing enzyme)